MESESCYEENCLQEVEYKCKCASPEINFCKPHWIEHCELSNGNHTFTSVYLKPCEETKQTIIQYLTKEISKKDKLRRKIIASFQKIIGDSEKGFEDYIRKLDLDSEEISNYLKKIYEAQKISKKEQDPILKLLTLDPETALENAKTLLLKSSDSYNSIKIFHGFSEEIEKMIECCIKNKFESFLESRLTKIENTLQEHEEIIKFDGNYIEKVDESIIELINSTEKDKIKFEEWNKEIKISLENELNSLNSQFSSITENLNKKLEETIQSQNQFNLNIINKLLIPQELKAKTFLNLNQKNRSDIENDFRITCSKYENELKEAITSEPSLDKAYQKYINSYNKNTSLYFIKSICEITNLCVYDTESGREEVEVLDIPEPLDIYTCITQLPKGKLFCFGKNPPSGIALIIDRKYKIQMLPSGTPCYCSSAIYFDRNVYCFGGMNSDEFLNLSERFDLDRNCWIKLSPMLKTDYGCHSIIFDRDILVSGKKNKNILRYSIDNDVFSAIPFEFTENIKKFLINGERLYLIECGGLIYESEIRDPNSWKQIAESRIKDNTPSQIYSSYNKGAIYIGCKNDDGYYMFYLDKKIMTAI